MAVKSSTDCERYARASKTLNGPTTCGTPGKPEKPNAARLTCCLVSDTPAVRFGNNWLKARNRAARLARMFWPLVITPRLYFNPRAIASASESGRMSGVAAPVGTLPLYKSLLLGPAFRADGDGAGVGGAVKPGSRCAPAGLQQQALQITLQPCFFMKYQPPQFRLSRMFQQDRKIHLVWRSWPSICYCT